MISKEDVELELFVPSDNGDNGVMDGWLNFMMFQQILKVGTPPVRVSLTEDALDDWLRIGRSVESAI